MFHAGCNIKADIFFVLDGSNSIKPTDFERVKLFEKEFVRNMTIGPDDDQVGTIIFDVRGRIIFNLSTHDNTNDVLCAIDEMVSPHGSYTNTADGLCQMVRHGFREENGARPAVMRIAIVVTDGNSNCHSIECNWTIAQAAEAVHRLTPPVIVYVLGVCSNTDTINEEELKTIATTPDDFTLLNSFNWRNLHDVEEKHLDKVCKEGRYE